MTRTGPVPLRYVPGWYHCILRPTSILMNCNSTSICLYFGVYNQLNQLLGSYCGVAALGPEVARIKSCDLIDENDAKRYA